MLKSKQASSSLPQRAVIYGIKGLNLTLDEMRFFSKCNPLGFILFSRNISTREQVVELVASLREITKNKNILILIDQEGGRVARLKPPLFRECPPAQVFANMAIKDLDLAKEECFKNAVEIGEGLRELGINVNCAPVADLYYPYADKIIGDRSYGSDVDIASELAKSMADGLAEAGVLPIIKHIPGHGRALVDSHELLPIVDTDLAELEATDFEMFKRLKTYPMAMTAHVVYSRLDNRPVTFSEKSLNYIRSKLKYKGIFISDDLSMKALSGTFDKRAALAAKSGCEILLHCNGNMMEMKDVLETCPMVDDSLNKKLKACYKIINKK